MPIKSKAQRRKFAELLVEGEVSPETFEKWNRAAGKAGLPERLRRRRKRSRSARRNPSALRSARTTPAKKGSRSARKRG